MSTTKRKLTLSFPTKAETASPHSEKTPPAYGAFNGPAGHKAQRVVIEESADVTNKDDPYAAFHRIRQNARTVLPKPDTETHNGAEQKSGEEGKSPEYIVAIAVRLPLDLTHEEANATYKAIGQSTAKQILGSFYGATVIQEIAPPERSENNEWDIDIILRSSIDSDGAQFMYKKFLEERGQKSGLNLFDPETAHSWAVRHDASEMLDTIMLDISCEEWTIASKNLLEVRTKMERLNGERSLTGSTAYMMIMG